MKTTVCNSLKCIVAFQCLLLALFVNNASAEFLYWNNNGLSTPTNGTWDATTPQWALDSTPTDSPVIWNPAAAAVFSVTNAGVGYLGNLNINVDSTLSIGGIYNNGTNGSSPVTNLIFTGTGSLELSEGVNVIAAGNSSIGGGGGNNNIFKVPLTGAGSVEFQAAVGSEYLAVSNSYSGGTTINTANGINFSTNNVFGSGPITIAPSLSQIVLATPIALPASAGGTPFATNNPIHIPNDVVANTVGAFRVILVGNTSAPITFSGSWDLGTTAQTLDFRSSTTTIAGVISGSGPSLTKIGANGILVLSGSNTYSGKTLINVGTISVNSINSVSGGSASSSLGAPTTVADGTINLGATTTAGTLIYTGAGETTDRVINLAGTTGGGVIQNDGSGALVFTSDFTVTGAGVKTLTLQGTNTNNNNRIGGAIVNGASATAVTKAQAGTWTLAGSNTFTGNLSITGGGKVNFAHPSAMGGGTNIISGTAVIDNHTGADLTVPNALTLSGGSLTYVGASNNMTYAGPVTISAANRTITVSSNMVTLNSGIDDLGQGRAFTKAGAGTLRLLGANTYTGNTVVNAGTLLLGPSASFATANNCTIAASATLDASAIAAFTVPGTNVFTASGSNTVEGVSAAVIKGGTTVNLGTRPITLTFRPTSFAGDTGHPSLIVSQGTLSLGGNAFTVNNASGTALGAGTYQLISQTSGNISSSGSNSVTVTGSGLVANATAQIVVTNGDVNLVVTIVTQPATIATPTIVSNGAVQLSFTGTAGAEYFIDGATNLNAPITWIPLSTNTADINGLFNFTDNDATNFVERYYRARNQ